MKQTPVHDRHNPDLLRLIPQEASRLIEVGCSSGALAGAFKNLSPHCHYVGVELDPHYAELARRHCDQSLALDIESAHSSFWLQHADRDCWIFGDTLEHLRDPWSVLGQIRRVIPQEGVVVACIPNAQHWSMQVRLSIGDFQYQEQGLLDKTHLRWFTRKTMFEMFGRTGFEVDAVVPRIFDEPNRARFLPLIEALAARAGADPKAAASDAMPLQYVLRAKPR